jgi:hypothetical protein
MLPTNTGSWGFITTAVHCAMSNFREYANPTQIQQYVSVTLKELCTSVPSW